jgi:hypothetical protein
MDKKTIMYLGLAVLLASIYVGYNNLKEPTYHEKNLESRQVELKVPSEMINVLTKEGKLSKIGWSKSN